MSRFVACALLLFFSGARAATDPPFPARGMIAVGAAVVRAAPTVLSATTLSRRVVATVRSMWCDATAVVVQSSAVVGCASLRDLALRSLPTVVYGARLYVMTAPPRAVLIARVDDAGGGAGLDEPLCSWFEEASAGR